MKHKLTKEQFRIGLVADLRTYQEYFEKFHQKYGSKILEIHLLNSDFPNLEVKIPEVAEFIKKNSVEDICFHSVDSMVQTTLFEEDTVNFDEEERKFYLMIDLLKKMSTDLDQDVNLVIHQGIKLSGAHLKTLNTDQLITLRKKYLSQSKKSYELLLTYVEGSRLIPMLESSPPSCASDDGQHFIDLAFEDFIARLDGNRRFVLDLSHVSMCIAYFKQDKIRFPALEALREQHGGIPKSLESLENYITMCAPYTRWVHINDADGMLGENEGLVIGTSNSLIDFHKVFTILSKDNTPVKGVLELVNSHKDYSVIDRSMENLIQKLIE